MDDEILFKRSKTAKWEIRVYESGHSEVYGNHIGCKLTTRSAKARISEGHTKGTGWSWFIDDGVNECWGCGVHVPDYIQALMRMYENK